MTGAGQGIGRAIALAFAREGAHVCASDIDAATGAATANDIRAQAGRAHFVAGDVGVGGDCEAIVREASEALGGLDVLSNTAAWARPGTPIAATDDGTWTRTFDVCVGSVFWMMRAAYPHLKRSGRASVINFTSNAGSEGMAWNAPYAAAKEAIRGLTRSAAKEWARDGIRVNAIRPIAASPSTARFLDDNPRIREAQLAAIPLGRLGDCDEDIAPVAVFLASDEARYLTAVTLPVDGGGGTER